MAFGILISGWSSAVCSSDLIDGDFKLDNSCLAAVKAGFRYQKLSTSFVPIRFYQGPETTTSAAAFAVLFESMPFKDYFDGTSRLEHDYLTAITSNLGNAADWENVRQTIGLTDQPEVSPQSVYDMSEIGRAPRRERVCPYV